MAHALLYFKLLTICSNSACNIYHEIFHEKARRI